MFIQWINNKTMVTFHSARRVLAQWNVLLCFQSTLHVLNEAVIKVPAELHTLSYTVSHVVKSVAPFYRYTFSQWDSCLGDEYFWVEEKGKLNKQTFALLSPPKYSRFSLIVPVSPYRGGWTVLSKSRASGGQHSMKESTGNNDAVGPKPWTSGHFLECE